MFEPNLSNLRDTRGGLGFARFAYEIAQQEDTLDLFFDVIVVTCASGSTLGGMIAGFKLLSQQREKDNDADASARGVKNRRLIGIDCFANPEGQTEELLLEIARGTASKIGLSAESVQSSDVHFDTRWNAGKYGYVDERTKNALKLAAGLEGVLLDPVYSGKAMAGVIGMAEAGELSAAENVLFVHTRGIYSKSF